ncbi:MAG: oligosaccharide flippase family protein [Candidatus Micrarchaeia archaeon]
MASSASTVNGIGARAAHVATFLMLGQLASTVLAGIAFIVIARILGPSTYGIYTLAIAVSALFGAVGDFGIGTAFNKFIAEYKAHARITDIEHLLADGFAAVAMVGLLFAILTLLFSSFLASTIMHSASYAYIVDVVSLIVFLSMIFTPAYSALVGFGKGAYVAMIMASQAIVQAAVGITLAIYGFGAIAPIIGIISGFAVGIVIAIYYIYVKQKLRVRAPSAARIKKLMGFSLPLAVSNVLGAVSNNFSLLFLGIFVSSAVIGYIGVSTRTISILGVLTGSISLSILPMFSSTLTTSLKRHIGRIYNYAIYVAFLLITPVILFIAVLARPFVVTVFGAAYGNAALFVAIIGIGTLVGLVGTYTSMLLISASKVRKVLKYNAIMVVVELALMPAFVIGLKGLGFVLLFYALAPVLLLALYVHAVRGVLNIKLRWKRILRVVLAGLLSTAMLLPLMLLFGSNFIPLLVAALAEQLIAYPAIVAATGAASRRDLGNLSSLMSGVPVLGYIMRMLTRYAALFVRS